MSAIEYVNPIWYSLNGAHRHLAGSRGAVCWYPSAIAPFVAVPSSGAVPELERASSPGLSDPAYFVGVVPTRLPEGWRVEEVSQILQMVPRQIPAAAVEDGDCKVLTASDRPAMLVLAQLAFPDFFRERTAELGTYLGLFDSGDLVAMAGERMALTGAREISGVCTHPRFQGRGSARRLTRALMYRHRQEGVASFLHVSEGNLIARRLYESMGFVERASLTMVKVRRNFCLEQRPTLTIIFPERQAHY